MECSYPFIHINLENNAQYIIVNDQIYDLRTHRININYEYYVLFNACSTDTFPPVGYIDTTTSKPIHMLLCRIGSLKRVHLSNKYYIFFNSNERRGYLKKKDIDIEWEIDFISSTSDQITDARGVLIPSYQVEDLFNSCG